ncbi:igLON family member 5 [Alligator sinensis]|uniref:IgLON family member 5 n=1 Tax=Alligator sinensis TaxID=38654 RepID=A0A1U7SHF2_ALLSI|nr:igLON family member 5 [Alligator sinensis]
MWGCMGGAMGQPRHDRLLLRLAFLLLSQGLLARGLDYNQPPENYTVRQGDNATLSSNILFAGRDKWSLDPRVQLLAHSAAEFAIAIARVDAYDEGLYTCSFQTRLRPHTAQLYLIVQVPARITNISSSVTVNESSNVNLLCLAAGKPEPSVTWQQLKDGFTSEGEYLEITGITREQAGEYKCITDNGVASSDSRTVLVTVNYPPVISETKNLNPPLGKSAILRCEAMAVPPANFEWFKDDKLLTGRLEGLEIRNERTRSMLHFANVSAWHYGNYTCLASNKLGTSSISLRLIRPDALESAAGLGLGSPIVLGLLASAFVTLLLRL